jgi:hypothetical protein
MAGALPVISTSLNNRQHGEIEMTDNVTTFRRGGVSPPRLLDRRNGKGGHTPPLQYAMLDDVIKTLDFV